MNVLDLKKARQNASASAKLLQPSFGTTGISVANSSKSSWNVSLSTHKSYRNNSKKYIYHLYFMEGPWAGLLMSIFNEKASGIS